MFVIKARRYFFFFITNNSTLYFPTWSAVSMFDGLTSLTFTGVSTLTHLKMETGLLRFDIPPYMLSFVSGMPAPRMSSTSWL